MNEPSVVILVADGLTPAVLDQAIADGAVPELAAMRQASGRLVLTTSFPSVTALAYIPMVTGFHPADAGIPGLRWYDRARQLPALLGHSRSYVGTQIRAINKDLSRHATTVFERFGGNALGASAVVTRGLPRRNHLDRGITFAAGVIRAHVTGDVARWAALEEEIAETLVRRVRRERPRFVFAAFTAGDKAAHAAGVDAAGVRRSLQLVDHVAASIRRDAERDGRWQGMHLWVVSDHGHSRVSHHLDLAELFRTSGIRVRAHPWTFPDRSEAAVMVSGNSMAHVYLGLSSRRRRSWPELERGWRARLDALLGHPAIDLVATQHAERVVEVRRRGERAHVLAGAAGLTYRMLDGNPLGIESFENLGEDAVHERTCGSAYPDSVSQLARLTLSERSGDLVISAMPEWDLRRRYEPIDHVSSHGALHAAHMLVPLLGNRGFPERPRRTTDLFRFLSHEFDGKR